MIETHPFGSFVPQRSKYLLLGSFASRQSVNGEFDGSRNWFYVTKVNQFWPILRQVYRLPLETRKDKEQLFANIGLAISDIIYQCERRKGTNLDNNLTGIVYNFETIENILSNNPITKIYFSSRFVEGKFKSKFKYLIERYPQIELVTLPSPSPRYAAMKLVEKVQRYRKLLPRQH